MTERLFVELLVVHFGAHCAMEIALPHYRPLLKAGWSSLVFSATLLWTLSASAGDGWSGIRVYLGEPRAAWSGESDCGPCNRFCADLRAYNRNLKSLGGKGWRVGYSEEGSDGQPNRIVLLKAMPDEATPYFVPVLRGVEDRTKRINGYGGEYPANVESIIAIDPLGSAPVGTPSSYSARRTVPLAATLSDDEPRPAAKTVVVYRDRIVEKPVYVERKVYATPPRVQNTYTPHWTWPGDLRAHLVAHGWPASYVNSLSMDQMEALHDRCHDTRRVNPDGTQNRPIASASTARARTYSTVTPSRSVATSGVQIFGAPIFGTYSTRSSAPPMVRSWSACPGGRCP